MQYEKRKLLSEEMQSENRQISNPFAMQVSAATDSLRLWRTNRACELEQEKQRVKSNDEVTANGRYYLNDLLDNLVKVCEQSYNKQLAEGIPSAAVIKTDLSCFITGKVDAEDTKAKSTTLFALIDRFCNGDIKYRGKEKSKGSLQNYRAIRKHLQTFEKAELTALTFDSITLDFFYRYTGWLRSELNLAHNTIAKDVSIIKVFMGEAVDLGLTANMQFKHKKFSMPEVNVDSCYLTDKEILKLYRFNLSKLPKLEKVRDMFVFGCYVGLRHSDYSTIRPENIVVDNGSTFIKVITKKTKTLVIIPANPIVLEIFDKYSANENRLPRTISQQNFNRFIKQAAELAGLDEIGRDAGRPQQPLFELITSHTARRSFATNHYLQGFPIVDLMRTTGHSSERSLLKYLKISKFETAKRLEAHIANNASLYSLRAVG